MHPDNFNQIIVAPHPKPKPEGLPWQVWAILALAAVAIALQGCATVYEHNAAKDWPKLTIRDNVVSGWQVQRHCYQYVPLALKLLGVFPMACAEINFDARTCDIWRAYDASPEMIEHEQIHCAGGQHPGDTTLTDAWTAYKARK